MLSNALIQKAVSYKNESTPLPVIETSIGSMTVYARMMNEIISSAEIGLFAVCFALAFSFLPGMVASVLVKETQNRQNQIQLISGLPLHTYSLANSIMESLFMYVPVWLSFICMKAFGLVVCKSVLSFL